jgi:hypothetical protein
MKKMNVLNHCRKLTASLVIALQMSGVAVASAAPAPTQIDDVRERDLLTSLIALDGQNISKSDYQKQIFAAMNEYDAQSTQEGRTERMTQAVIDMQIMTPSQASNMKQNIEARINSALAANPNLTDDQRKQVTIQATADAIKNVNAGAQFSACTGFGLGASAILALAILQDVYASTIIHHTSVTTVLNNYSGSDTTTTVVSGDTTTTTTISTAQGGTTTQTVSTVSGNETARKMVLATSGIEYGIAGVMFIYMLSSDVCGVN